MNTQPPPQSDRLTAAQDRLARAIGRLEAAIQNINFSDGSESRLINQVKSLQGENAQLRAAVDNTVQQLDDTIAKFKEKLAG